jgi:hypothetical protein
MCFGIIFLVSYLLSDFMQGSSAMPSVFQKEEQSKGSMTTIKPTPWGSCKKTPSDFKVARCN